MFVSGSPATIKVQLSRDDDAIGPVIAPFFPQVTTDRLSLLLPANSIN